MYRPLRGDGGGNSGGGGNGAGNSGSVDDNGGAGNSGGNDDGGGNSGDDYGGHDTHDESQSVSKTEPVLLESSPTISQQQQCPFLLVVPLCPPFFCSCTNPTINHFPSCPRVVSVMKYLGWTQEKNGLYLIF